MQATWEICFCNHSHAILQLQFLVAGFSLRNHFWTRSFSAKHQSLNLKPNQQQHSSFQSYKLKLRSCKLWKTFMQTKQNKSCHNPKRLSASKIHATFLIYSQSNMDTTWQQMGFLEYFTQVSYNKRRRKAFATKQTKLLHFLFPNLSFHHAN